MKISGVYEIRHKKSGKVYIGSSKNAPARLRRHLYSLRHDLHPNRHLQAAFDLYGSAEYEFCLLVRCAPADLLFYEQSIIDGLSACDPDRGYNKRTKAESNAGLGSETQRAAVSAMMRDPIRSASQRAAARALGKRDRKRLAGMMAALRVNPEVENRRKLRATEANRRRAGFTLSDGQKGKYRATVRQRNLSGRPINVGTPRKLTAEQVIEIRASILPKKALARRYGIHEKTLRGVLSGRTYNWVGTQGGAPQPNG
jgi:group I intron endonuclease